MGIKNIGGVRKVVRGGKPRWLLDFPYTDQDGIRRRFRRFATVQNYAASLAEASRLMRRAAATGIVEEEAPKLEAKPPSTKVTYRTFVETTFNTRYLPSYRPATAARYRALHKQRVLAFFGDLALDEIKSSHYREFDAVLKTAGLKNKGPITLVRSVLLAAVESEHITEAPKVPKNLIDQSNKVPDAPSAEDIAALMSTTGWLGLAIALAAYAGMRMGEIRAIEVRDVDFQGRTIFIRRALSEDVSLTPKSGKERKVPLHPGLAARLTEATTNKFPRARIVADEAGDTPPRQHVLHLFKKQLKKLGLRERSFHSLRHFFVSELLRQGVGAETVRELAGHSKLEMTQRYAHSTSKDHRDAIDKLG